MPKLLLDVSEDEILEIFLQLPPEIQRTVIKKIMAHSEVWGLMKLSESSFSFWNDPAEDIYEV